MQQLGQGSSIIYCRSRKQTESVANYLGQCDIGAAAYHAGMQKEKRDEAQNAWMADRPNIMVATTAFGMGIDKPNVRLVLHYDAPEHIEAYYQEAGRAGRDGLPANAIAYYNSTDINRLIDSTDLHYPPGTFLKKVYQSVAEFLQIPIGCEPNQYYAFDVIDFCHKFKLEANKAIHALKLLERENLWTLTEPVYNPSTIQFVVDRHTVDALGNYNKDLEYVAVGLLRMYNSVFFFQTPIRETAICKQLKINRDELAKALGQLHNMGIIEYNKPSEGPQLFFHHYRVDSRHLQLDFTRINNLRMKHIARTEAMIAFLENKSICRERLVLEYFGETPTKDCGHCDVCRDKSSSKIPTEDLTAQLLNKLQNSKSVTIHNLVIGYPIDKRMDAVKILRQWLDEGVLVLLPNGEVVLNQN